MALLLSRHSSKASTASSNSSSSSSKLSLFRRSLFPSSRLSSQSITFDADTASSIYSSDSSSSSESSTSLSEETPPSPDAPKSILVPSTIPIEEIHNHTGHHYFPPPQPSPRNGGLRRLFSATSKASLKDIATSSRARQTITRTSLPSIPPPGAPAITIHPPDTEPAQVFRPSVSRLALRHSKSSLRLGGPSSQEQPVVPIALPQVVSPNSRANIYGGFRGVRTGAPPVTPMATIVPSSISPRKKERGLTPPEPLDPKELDDDRLSICWNDRAARVAQAQKMARARTARVEAARLQLTRDMNRYSAPLVVFPVSGF